MNGWADVVEAMIAIAIVTATPWLIWQALNLLYAFWQAVGVM
jgi:hypothetical protein